MKILSFLILFICSNVFASTWKSDTVYYKDKAAGHIYHTSAIGTLLKDKSQKFVTSLRFICSVKNSDVIIGIHWGNSPAKSEVTINAFVDNTVIRQLAWRVDESLIYRPVSETLPLIQDIKTAKIIKFQWQLQDGSTYTTAFNVAGADFTDFNTKCKTQI